MYYNPTIVTDVGRKFLSLLDKHFKPGDHLHKHINRNTVKISYSTCPNMKTQTSKHNAKVLRKEDSSEKKECKCLKKQPECPVEGKCQTSSVVYKAEVEIPNTVTKSYIGLTKNEFIKRYQQHQAATALSRYVWEMKEKIGVQPKIKWKIVTRAYSFSSRGRQCDLCLSGKREILHAKKSTSLNIRDELLYMCKHKFPERLANFKPQFNKTQTRPKKQKNPAITWLGIAGNRGGIFKK